MNPNLRHTSVPSSGVTCCRRLTVIAGTVWLGYHAGAESWDKYEPHWLQLAPPQFRLAAEVEGLRENIRSDQAGDSVHENISVTPLIGMKLSGSVYHPNLLSFDVDGEVGLGFASDRVSSISYDQRRDEKEDVERYDVQLHFLDSKPYHATLFASQDHFYRNYDFFNTATVDTSRYAGRMDWRLRRFDLNAEAGYREERTSGSNGDSALEDTYFNFNGQHERDHGTTTLSYNFDDLAQSTDGFDSMGTTHSLYASDSESLGSRQQITLTTAAGYSRFDYTSSETETINASENLKVNHSDKLDSFAYADYSHTDEAPAESSVFYGATGVRHHGPKDLNTTFEVHGNYDDYSNTGNSGSSDRYGVALRADYLRPLRDWGRLAVGGGAVADHEDRTVSGQVLSIPSETYSVYAPGAGPGNNFLKNPNIITGTIQVRTTTGLLIPPGGNYNIVVHGVQTEIERVPGSVLLPTDGQSVLVSYNYLAPPTSQFEALNLSAQVRLDLFDHYGIYSRINWLDNNAPPEALVQTLTDVVGGADVHWRWFRAGAEYEDYDSNYSRYHALRLFQALNFRLDDSSNLGLNFNQLMYHYENSQDSDETQYQFMGHLDTQLTTWLNWNIEGGYYLRDYTDTHEDMAAVRTNLSASWGKLSARAGYQYNYQWIDQPANREQRDRNFFYVYLRRVF